MGEIDPEFIQPPEHRPKLYIIEDEGMPLIDLSAINSISDPEAIERIVREIGNACKQWGFFQVINHGVPVYKLQKIEAATRKFFAQPLEEKRKTSLEEWDIRELGAQSNSELKEGKVFNSILPRLSALYRRQVLGGPNQLNKTLPDSPWLGQIYHSQEASSAISQNS